jgi:hypothetical protein
MALASELDKIRYNSIEKRLGAFPRLFESTRSDLCIALSSGAIQIVFATAAPQARFNFFYLASLLTYIVTKSLVLDLNQALQIKLAARTLPSLIANITVSGNLAILY